MTMQEWEYIHALEVIIDFLLKSKPEGWGEYEIHIPTLGHKNKHLILKIKDKSGKLHRFRASLNGDFIPLPARMSCF